MERTIKVTGRGRLLVKPDTVRLTMTLEGTELEYEKALEQSAHMSEQIKDLFVRMNFERESIKTQYFNVRTEYEGYSGKDGKWKQRFKGYTYTHRLKVEFPSNQKRLGEILYALGHAAVRPEIHIEYTVAAPQKSKNELLAKAVSDAKQKAEVLASAAGVPLGELVSMDYSWGELEFVTRPMQPMALQERCMSVDASENEAYALDMEPEDIEVEDTVTMVWMIGV